MKKLFFVISLFLSFNISAQLNPKEKTPFVRVYDLYGKEFGKGKVISVADSFLILKNFKTVKKISVSFIGNIKTKHSAGNNILVGAGIGAGLGGIVAGAGGGSYYGGDIIVAGMGAGALLGGVIGALTIPIKDVKTYEINGQIEKWQEYKKVILDAYSEVLEEE